MRQRRFMAMILIVLFMTWTVGTTVIATGSENALTLTTGMNMTPAGVLNSTSGGGIDITPPPAGGTTTTSGGGIDTTTDTALDATTGSGLGLPNNVPALITPVVTVNKTKVISGETVLVTLHTTTNSAVGLNPSATVCFANGSADNQVQRELTMSVQPDGTYIGAFDVDDSVRTGAWKVKYTITIDSFGTEIKTFNSVLNGGIGIDMSSGDFAVVDDTIKGLSDISVSRNIANSIDSIEVSVTADIVTAEYLGNEASVCYSTGTGSGRVEKQLTLKLALDGTLKGNFSVDETTKIGLWKVDYVVLNTTTGNVTVIYNTEIDPESGMNMSAANIQVPEAIAPEFKSISVDKNQAYFTDKVAVEVLTTTETGKDLAPEAAVCYTIGSGSSEVENQLTLKLTAEGTYKGFMNIDEFTKMGLWKVKYVIINDNKENVRITYNSDVCGIGMNMSAGNVEVIGDKIPDFNALTVSSNDAKSGDKVLVTLTTTAESAATLAAEAFVCYSNGNGISEKETQLTLRLNADGSYKGIFSVDEFTAPGTWKVKYVIFGDNKDNVKVVYNSNLLGIGNDMSTANIVVAGETVPGYVGITLSNNLVGAGDTINFVLATTATSSAGLAREAFICYSVGSGKDEVEKQLTLTVNPDGTYSGALSIDEFTTPGVWKIKYIILGDDKNNVQVVYNSVINNGIGSDLSAGNFEAKTSAKFTFEQLTIDNSSPKLFEKVTVTLQASISTGELADEATACYTLQTANGPIEQYVTLTLVDGKYVGSIDMDNSSYRSGLWKISYIVLESKSGDVAIAYNSNVHLVTGLDLKAADFNYVSPIAKIMVNGYPLYNFGDLKFDYDMPMLPWSTVVPDVQVVTAGGDSSTTSAIEVKKNAELPGTTQIVLTSIADTSKSIVYNLNFRKINTGYSVEYVDGKSSVQAGSMESISVKITNNTGKAGSPVLMLAVYDKNGSLVRFVKATASIANAATVTLTTPELLMPEDSSYTVKAYVWESEGNARPLAKYKEFTVQP